MFLFLLLSSCMATRGVASPDALLQADRNFSLLSKTSGLRTAFLQYMDDSAVLLKANKYPIIGAAARQFYQQQPDDTALTWTPQAAYLARSGELGYTFGIWSFATKDTTLQGTYVTIWKKAKKGTWKFVLDSGNSGLGTK